MKLFGEGRKISALYLLGASKSPQNRAWQRNDAQSEVLNQNS